MNPTSTHTTRMKGTLFCPDCGFESPPDGEWELTESARTRRLVCPDCGAVVDERAESRACIPQPAD